MASGCDTDVMPDHGLQAPGSDICVIASGRQAALGKWHPVISITCHFGADHAEAVTSSRKVGTYKTCPGFFLKTRLACTPLNFLGFL